MSTGAETERVRRIQDKTAPKYDRQISFFERILFAGGREWVCSQARGRVLELACGTARNLPFYAPDVELTGVELSPEMLAIGRARRGELGRRADLRLGDVQDLDLPDEGFDTVTCTLGFCTIPDPRRAAAEALRVLRPGGELLMLEHVRSPSTLVRGAQRLLEPLSVRFEADHLLRDPVDYLPDVGFEIDEVQRSKWGIVERLRAHRPVYSRARLRETASGTNESISATSHASVPRTGRAVDPPVISARTASAHKDTGFTSAKALTASTKKVSAHRR